MIRLSILSVMTVLIISSCNNSTDNHSTKANKNVSNKKVTEPYMEGFNKSGHAQILSCLTDSVIWEMPGFFSLTGKEQFDKETENPNFEGSPTIKIIRLVEEGDIVIAEGTVQGKMKNGGF
jgi:uncharacterized protein